MQNFDIKKLDITQLNASVDRLLTVTENPRHRFMLMAYARHRALELAGRYPEIFAPDMMAPEATYHFIYGGNNIVLTGQDRIKSLYSMWAQTNQSIFYIEHEEIAISDHNIFSVATAYQQVSGKTLRDNKLLAILPKFISRKLVEHTLAKDTHTVNDNDMYLYKAKGVQMIWPYDDQCRLLGEDVYEPLVDQHELIKIDAKDVMTTAQARKLLDPIIHPLPSFEEMVLGKKANP
jgi:hypothetical protein